MAVVGEKLESSFGNQQNYTQSVGDLLNVTFPQNKVVACNVQQGEEVNQQDNNARRCMWFVQSVRRT